MKRLLVALKVRVLRRERDRLKSAHEVLLVLLGHDHPRQRRRVRRAGACLRLEQRLLMQVG